MTCMTLRTFASLLLLILFHHSGADGRQLSPAAMGTGGAGTALTTGYESLFINPANLFLQERQYRLEIALMSAGMQIDTPLRTGNTSEFRSRYLALTEGVRTPVPFREVNSADLLERNFAGGLATSDHLAIGELHWFGVHWMGERRSYAVAARTRFGNRFETGRAFYESVLPEADDASEANRSLTHRFRTLHEISFGYAESYDFLSGMIPNLSRLVIGVAPKVVVGGGYLDAEIRDLYRIDGSEIERSRLVRHHSAGRFSDWTRAVASASAGDPALAGREDLFRPAGLGAGLDFGITWLMLLGDEIPPERFSAAHERSRSSIRVSLALTDVGIVRYSDEPLSYLVEEQAGMVDGVPQASSVLFEGRPGEHLPFLIENGHHPLAETVPVRESFSVALPSTLRGGILLQLNRVRVTADLSLGLTDDAFQNRRLVSHLGAEFRVLRFLPLRIGMRTAPDMPDLYTFGVGIDLGRVEVSAALQLRSRSDLPTSEIIGLSAGSMRIFFP